MLDKLDQFQQDLKNIQLVVGKLFNFLGTNMDLINRNIVFISDFYLYKHNLLLPYKSCSSSWQAGGVDIGVNS